MVKAVIFDLDGTLLDTLPDLNACMNEMLKFYGFPQISLAQTRLNVGHGGKKFVELSLPEDKRTLTDECYAYYRKVHIAWKNEKTKMFKGEREFLLKLKKCGVKTAIVTNKAHASTLKLCETILKEFKFDAVLGVTDKYPVKPNPESTLAIIKELGVNAKDCVFVGDGETDFQTATNANIKCVSVLWGYRTKEELMEVGANVFAETYKQLEEIIFAK